jgi:hypothetical protein
MVTRLDKPLRRELLVEGEPWIATLMPSGLKLVRKGRRKGMELGWKAITTGDAALAVALNASLAEPRRARGADALPERPVASHGKRMAPRSRRAQGSHRTSRP